MQSTVKRALLGVSCKGWSGATVRLGKRVLCYRAKCIQCSHCGGFFSPNKFIFHSHRHPDAVYVEPDAANFNAWRRHLTLAQENPSDQLLHAWEDVKAMFNGGSRKRPSSDLSNTPSDLRETSTCEDNKRTKNSPVLPDHASPTFHHTEPVAQRFPPFHPFSWPYAPASFHPSFLLPPVPVIPHSISSASGMFPFSSRENVISSTTAMEGLNCRVLQGSSAFRALKEPTPVAASTYLDPTLAQHQGLKLIAPEANTHSLELFKYTMLTKEQLQALLLTEIEARKKLECDLNILKEAFLKKVSDQNI